MHWHGQQIASLPVIHSAKNLKIIHQFYQTMNVSVNSLKTMRRKNFADLISPDPDQQDWKFQTLLNELRGFSPVLNTLNIS